MKYLDRLLKDFNACGPARQRFRNVRTLEKAYKVATESDLDWIFDRLRLPRRRLRAPAGQRCSCGDIYCRYELMEEDRKAEYPLQTLKNALKKKGYIR